jgi:hypothetical protein
MKDNSEKKDASSYFLSSRLFLKLLALTYLVAFWSLAVQIVGLVGSRGIMPATYFLNVAHQQLGRAGYWLIPGIFWLNSSDLFLQIVCVAGILFRSCWLFCGSFIYPCHRSAEIFCPFNGIFCYSKLDF